MRYFLALLPFALLGCTAVDTPERTARTQERLDRALAGLVAGAPQRCISRLRTYDLDIVDDRTALFRSGRNLVYRADFPNGCGSLDPTRTLSYTTVSSEICRGDIVRPLDRVTGNVVGSCAFSDFVPYTRPGSGADPRGS